MARIWSEPYDSARHRNPMNWGWGAPRPEQRDRHNRAPTLEPHHVVFVRAADFTFEFHSVEQIRACLTFYGRKHQPTSRLPVQSGDYGGDQHETQRWFERLPLYLREEPKREQVVAALDEALRLIATGKVQVAAV
jgi:hypothetical protein